MIQGVNGVNCIIFCCWRSGNKIPLNRPSYERESHLLIHSVYELFKLWTYCEKSDIYCAQPWIILVNSSFILDFSIFRLLFLLLQCWYLISWSATNNLHERNHLTKPISDVYCHWHPLTERKIILFEWVIFVIIIFIKTWTINSVILLRRASLGPRGVGLVGVKEITGPTRVCLRQVCP